MLCGDYMYMSFLKSLGDEQFLSHIFVCFQVG